MSATGAHLPHSCKVAAKRRQQAHTSRRLRAWQFVSTPSSRLVRKHRQRDRGEHSEPTHVLVMTGFGTPAAKPQARFVDGTVQQQVQVKKYSPASRPKYEQCKLLCHHSLGGRACQAPLVASAGDSYNLVMLA